MAEIKVPTLGESVTEATVSRWLKKPGEAVAMDEPLVELETDKVTLEVNAPNAGVMGEQSVAEGATVAVGAAPSWLKNGKCQLRARSDSHSVHPPTRPRTAITET